MQYRAEIDGLRSIAVLPVILFHAGLSVFSGGFVGVDVFFVISGYLITTIIIEKIEDDRFSIMEFYARRFKRILPALFLVVLVSLPLGWVLMMPTQFKDFAQSIAAVSIFLSNVLFWHESGYFAPTAEMKPLLHTWSLAIEEQYYVLFPIILWLVWKRPRLLWGLFVAVMLLSLALAEVLGRVAPETNFYLLPTRAWELLAGSLCAVLHVRGYRRSGAVAALIGLLLVVGPVFLFDDRLPFPSLYAGIPVLGTCLILLFADAATGVGRLLAHRLPVALGLISYSAYLWHQPLFAFARVSMPHQPELWLMLGLAALSLVLAAASWRYVEGPCRRLSWSSRRVVIWGGVASLAMFCLGATLYRTDFQKNYYISNISDANRALFSEINKVQQMDHERTADDGACRFYIHQIDAAAGERFRDCHARHGGALVIFGDSHSMDIFHGLVMNGPAPFVVGIGQGACRPHVSRDLCPESDLARFLIAQSDRIATAVYVQAGFWLLRTRSGGEGDRMVFLTGAEPVATPDVAKIGMVADFLSRLATRFPVVWLGPRIEPHVAMERMLRNDCTGARDYLKLSEAHRGIFTALDAAIAAESRSHPYRYLSEQQLVGFDMAIDLYDCTTVYWSDGDHWSPAGILRFGPRLAPQIEALIPRRN